MRALFFVILYQYEYIDIKFTEDGNKQLRF